jgi:hypothetical protein
VLPPYSSRTHSAASLSRVLLCYCAPAEATTPDLIRNFDLLMKSEDKEEPNANREKKFAHPSLHLVNKMIWVLNVLFSCFL